MLIGVVLFLRSMKTRFVVGSSLKFQNGESASVSGLRSKLAFSVASRMCITTSSTNAFGLQSMRAAILWKSSTLCRSWSGPANTITSAVNVSPRSATI